MSESVTVGDRCLEVAVVELLYQTSHKGYQDRSGNHQPVCIPRVWRFDNSPFEIAGLGESCPPLLKASR